MFVDEAVIKVKAGKGGDGALAFRREKFVPRGGPSGGDGGKGGDVIAVATRSSTTLVDFRSKRHVRATAGQKGGNKNMTGRQGDDVILEVPVGTLIYDERTGEQLADLTYEGDRYFIAKGGRGGLGNQNFVTPRNRAPRKTTPGKDGEEVLVRLELKLLADVGLVGFPSVGKSTLIGAMSNARPKVAEYHFTTLVPSLGVVGWRDFKEYVIADIPGLIEGAHEGQGLGTQFLKHVERCNLLLHVLEVTPQLEGQEDGRDPIEDYLILNEELYKFNPELPDRPRMVVLNKIDEPRVQEEEARVRAYFESLEIPFLTISAAGRQGLDELRDLLGELVFAQREQRTSGKEWWEQPTVMPKRLNAPQWREDRGDDDGVEVVWVFEGQGGDYEDEDDYHEEE